MLGESLATISIEIGKAISSQASPAQSARGAYIKPSVCLQTLYILQCYHYFPTDCCGKKEVKCRGLI